MPILPATEYAPDTSIAYQPREQARSQKFAMGDCLGGLGAEPPALENFAFFC